MTSKKRLSSPAHGFLPEDVEGFDSLAELALDMRWSWSHYADEVWQGLDRDLFEVTHNPWVVLQTVSRKRLVDALGEEEFRQRVEELVREKREASESGSWFRREHSQASLPCVAYFSMEFMLSEALPIYSGGLGNVAGDLLKSASDLGVPVVGVGLLYQQGYFRQVISRKGEQQALFPYNDPGQLPITPLRMSDGQWLRLKIALPGYSVWLRAWQVQVGRVKLYLLDSNDAANLAIHRGITSELYGGGPELRLQQELLLGIGGWRLLEALDLHPEVCHLNEGHAALAALERARSFAEKSGQGFEVALAATRPGNLFTTHTAVPAGFDHFAPGLVRQYLGGYAKELGIGMDQLLALGRKDPGDDSETFNMAYLAIRCSGAVNAVSRLHETVSRRLFAPLFPRWPLEELPVGHVTNGVHMPSWESPAADGLWSAACGESRWLDTTESLEEDLRQVSDADLWKLRTRSRQELVNYVRERWPRQLEASGSEVEEIEAAGNVFDPEALTLAFARRFATYKRPTLLLHDPERLLGILTSSEHPVQLIVAGTAHPADEAGQELIHRWTQFMKRPEARSHVIFLSDYDMLLTQQLVRGVDVWVNTPRRPWEACGTSGMKVLANGGLNLSELDGWWAEAYTSDVGWALGDGKEHDEDPAWDAKEAEDLYRILEQEVVPRFYERQDGIPRAWVGLMRESMAQLTPRFSANRMVREYVERYYLPGAKACRQRMNRKGLAGQRLVDEQRAMDERWSGLRFGDARVSTEENEYAFEVSVHLSGLDPETVKVELYAQASDGGEPVHHPMEAEGATEGSDGIRVYRCKVPADRSAEAYTVRALPRLQNVSIPLEDEHILWQK